MFVQFDAYFPCQLRAYQIIINLKRNINENGTLQTGQIHRRISQHLEAPYNET